MRVGRKQPNTDPESLANGPTRAKGREAAQFEKDSRQAGKKRRSPMRLSRGMWRRVLSVAAHKWVRKATAVAEGRDERGAVMTTPRRSATRAMN